MSSQSRDWGQTMMLAAMVIGGFGICFYYHCSLDLAVCSVAISSLSIYKSAILSMSVIKGQGGMGILHLEKQRGISYFISLYSLKIFKVRARFLWVPILIMVLIMELTYESFAVETGFLPQTVNNLRAFVLTLVWMIGCVAVYWALNWKRYFFESEEEVRKYLKEQGLDVFEIGAQIQKFREMGLFGP